MTNSTVVRTFTPHELTHLARLGWSTDPAQLQKYGESPVEYITGQVEFGNRYWHISNDALIPRIETEELVALALKKCLDLQSTQNLTSISVLEVGTGSGVALLSLVEQLLPKFAAVKAVGLEISASALKVARTNETLLSDALPPELNAHWQEMSWLESDLLTTLSTEKAASLPKKFDCVIANLPYIPSGRIPFLDASVQEFEPHLALDGGEDGFRLIERCLRQLPPFLKPSTTIFLEVDYTHQDDLLQPVSDLYTWSTHVDQFLRQRFMVLQQR